MAVSLTRDQLPQLKSTLDRHLPQSYVVSTQIDHVMRGDWPMRIQFTVNRWPDWSAVRVDRAALPHKGQSPHYEPGVILFHTYDQDLREFLMRPEIFDWTKIIRFQACSREAYRVIQEVTSDLGSCVMNGDGDMMQCTPEDLVTCPLPSGLEYCQLTLDDADCVRAQEAYKVDGNYGYMDESMALMIQHPEVTPHICVRSTRGQTDKGQGHGDARSQAYCQGQTQAEGRDQCQSQGHIQGQGQGQKQVQGQGQAVGEKVGWIFTISYGTVGYLVVKEGYRSLGIGKHLVSEMTRRRLERGLPCMVHIRPDNLVSTAAVRHCGYRTLEGKSGTFFSFYPNKAVESTLE